MKRQVRPAGTMSNAAWQQVWTKPNAGLAAWICAFGNWVGRIVTLSMLKDVDLRGGTILDLGCGHAEMTMTILQKHKCRALTAVDFCQQAIESVQQRKGSLPVTTIQANLLTLELDQQFDLVYSAMVIEHFWGDARQEAIAQHARFTKPGGYVFINAPGQSLWSRMFHAFFNQPAGIYEEPLTAGELCALLSDHGLHLIRLRSLLAGSVLFALAQKKTR